MRLRRFVAVALVLPLVGFVIGAGPADAAKRPPKAKAVTGTYTGEAGFEFGVCPLVGYTSAGTYEAKRLGTGTYSLNTCAEVPGQVHLTGTIVFVTRKGARLNGTIDALLDSGLSNVPVTLTGGTKRFAGATGSLVLAITQSNQRNCDPRVGICFNWTEHAAITGTITKARPPKPR
jgi:hypothetical protein